MPHPRPLEFFHLKTELSVSAFELYQAVGITKDHFFLDSSKQDSPYSNYSIIGVNPHLIIKYEHGKVYTKDFTHVSTSEQALPFICLGELDIFDYLNSVIRKYSFNNTTELPFIGGGIGYFSYDLSKTLEKLPKTTTDEISMPDCYYVFYDNVILHKNNTNEVHLTGLGILEDPKCSVEKLLVRLNHYFSKVQCSNRDLPTPPSTPALQSPFTEKTYIEAVNSMRSYMEEGHIYVANMTHTFKGSYDDTPMNTYERLRNINPAPFAAYLDFEEISVLCSSPERFLKITDGKVQTRPIKGTVPRGRTPKEDAQNKQLLIDSEKDRSELLMIVDLERNDLSKVCRTGSVNVTELFEIETYATVFHLVSTIEGVLDEGKTSVDCIKATFPGGSITGAPKIRAMEIIDALEPTSRNIYTGCIGYLGYDGNADFNIVIRTIVLKDNEAYVGVGGGITWESDAKSEYDETLQKIKALFESMGIKPVNAIKHPKISDVIFANMQEERLSRVFVVDKTSSSDRLHGRAVTRSVTTSRESFLDASCQSSRQDAGMENFPIEQDIGTSPVLTVDDGISFGLSFFETFYISDSILFLNEHVTRLNNSLSHFNIPVHIDESLVTELVKKYELAHIALKLQVSEKNIIASTRPIAYTEDYYQRGAKLMTSPIVRSSRSELIRHKSANYGDLILSLRSAHTKGFDDCLFFNELGNITETCIANIFLIKDNILYTPSIKEGLLPGIIRNHLLMNYPVVELPLKENDLFQCDGAFLTNSLVGIVKIASVNGKKLPDNPLITDIQNKYFDFIKECHESTNQ